MVRWLAMTTQLVSLGVEKWIHFWLQSPCFLPSCPCVCLSCLMVKKCSRACSRWVSWESKFGEHCTGFITCLPLRDSVLWLGLPWPDFFRSLPQAVPSPNCVTIQPTWYFFSWDFSRDKQQCAGVMQSCKVKRDFKIFLASICIPWWAT